jgi:hypothetical protein
MPRLIGLQEVSDYSPDNINSPWRTVVLTVTSNPKIVMRIIEGGRVSVTRPLQGHELMAMIGWPDDDVPCLKEEFADQALLTSLAVNSFNGFQLFAILAAVLSTVGLTGVSAPRVDEPAS